MGKREPVAHRILDGDDMLAVIRCDEGDVATFYQLAAEILYEYCDEAPQNVRDVIKPPVWRWYRMNVCAPDGEYAWMLGLPKGPGRGNWLGAAVIMAPVTR